MNLELVSRENPEIQIARNYGQISFSYVSSSSPHGIRQFVKIQRDLTSDQFSVIVTVFSKIVGKVNVYVQVNNAAPTAPKLLELFPEKFNQAVFVFGGPNQIKDKTADFKFPKLDNILVYLTKENEQKILLDNVLKLRNFSDANKEYSIKNKGIGFKVLKSIKMANLGADASIEFSKTYEKIEENTIYFFPDKFSQKKHNQNVFKVGVDPEVFYAGNIDKNINITNLKLTNLPVKSTSGSKNYLDLSFQFRQDIYDKNKKPEVIAGKYIVGDIFIISNTYYDSTERTVFSGNSQISHQGFVIPYNFSGTLNPKVEMSINNDYKKINVAFSQEIIKKLIDYEKKNGIYKLKITNYSTPFIKTDQIRISNQDFKYVSTNFLTIQQLKDLSFTNFREEDEEKKLEE
ncbi:hypothetical protein DR094_00940 [Mycoplasma flocculare]|uniref:Uncharacterized protein n=1 Tax=Mesomycoplasma flocculare TaxID=2128 RepID=A0AAW9XCY9_MESFC|nr:hypothetical protein [Mesomycoplasma flocculare]MXR39247.1 hypothetical protein [Mycoplasma sp. MF12]MXR05661.1 hypothetical protein [Mesomycoplasma flocculare]MXR12031.1 hypothetical protein [Mesomycoplasma flocculare]MXR13291.1 hypothetical protein [Mesomycoplasma flocculare]MXR56563.1 hypothetical protein [Mesomycoplasma flocculare]